MDPPWTPLFLRRRTIVSFSSIFVATVVGLGVCYLLSNRNGGLCDAKSSYHYLWTYAPTAWFTLLAFIWSQVEYRAKQMQPWKSMATEPQEASDSVLLDYVSMWKGLVLFKAIKKRQVVVATTICISILLQLLIILSTALFTLSKEELTQKAVTIDIEDQFIKSGLQFQPSDVDARPAAYAVAFLETDFQTPSGSTKREAYQRFSNPNDLDGNVQSTETMVEVLSSTMDCEKASVHISTETQMFTGIGPELAMSSVPVITMGQSTMHENRHRAVASSTAVIANYSSPPTYNITWVSSVYSDGCGNVTLPSPSYLSGVGGLDIIFCPNGPREQSRRLLFQPDSEAFICRPEYCLRNQSVLLRTSSVEMLNHTRGQCQKIPDFDVWQLFGGMQQSIKEAGSFLNLDTNEFPALFNRWVEFASPSPRTNNTDWATLLEQTWSTFTAQAFNLYFKDPTPSTQEGTVVIMRERLVVRQLPFWLAECCMVVCIGLSLTAALCLSHIELRLDPSSILGLATILVGSQQLMRKLNGCGPASKHDLQRVLASSMYGTQISHSQEQQKLSASHNVRIYVETKPSKYEDSDSHSSKASIANITWYKPFSVSFMYVVGVLTTIIALVVILEVLLYVSQSRHGICDVAGRAGYDHFAWTALPAFVMSSLAWLVGLQLSTSRIFTPYSALVSRPQTATTTITRRPFSSLSVWKDIRNVEIFLTLSTISVLLSSFLAIVISGLFSAAPLEVTKAVVLRQQDWFPPSTFAYFGYLQSDLILNSNLTFPKFTYNDLAIARPKNIPSTNGRLQVRLPSIHGNINCSMVPSTKISMDSGPDASFMLQPSAEQKLAYAHFVDEYPCYDFQTGSTIAYTSGNHGGGNETGKSFLNHRIAFLTPKNGYFGGLVELMTSDYDVCPRAVGVFGQVTEGKVSELSLFTCTPFAIQIQADVQLALPENTFVTAPTTDEATATPFGVSFVFDEGSPLEALLSQNMIKTLNESDVFDPFMKTLVHGTYGIPAGELSGKVNQDRLLKAMNSQYGISFAQYMNAFRIPVTGANSPTLHGTLTETDQDRLYQSEIATHILAGLLCTILVTTIVTMMTMKSRHVLPKNPCSIAAVASLLADSDFLNMMPTDTDKLTDEELVELFDGYLFSMGWWAGREGEIGRRRFGIDFGIADNLR